MNDERKVKTRFDGKQLWRNNSGGFISIATIDPRSGTIKGRAIEAGEEVYLSNDEVEETARSHRNANPFAPQMLERRDPETGDVVERVPVIALVPVYEDEDSVELPPEARGSSGSESPDSPPDPAAAGSHQRGEEAGPALRHAHEIGVQNQS